MYNSLTFNRSFKMLIIALLLSFTSVFSYSAGVATPESAAEEVQPATTNSEKESLKTGPLCVVEAFAYVVDWVEKAIKRIENEHFSSQAEDPAEETAVVTPTPTVAPVAIIEEEPKVVLDLTLPDVIYVGAMKVDKGQKLNFPDLFSTQAKKPFSKEAPSSSFGGRLLMDDEQLENMDQYHFNNVREAVRGAEVSLEFKTN